MDLRSHMPICARVAYLNAGTDGPVAAEAAQAAIAAIESAAAAGRVRAHFEARMQETVELRALYAEALGAPPEGVALTTSTSDGLGRVLAGLDLGPGDEILTSDQEHPGLTGPLVVARRRGVKIRVGPLARLAEAVEPTTTMIACSHVGWITGELADPALGETGLPLILDGAQGVGAVPTDVVALGCAAYAAAGQKWMCGADGTGMLYLRPDVIERARPIVPGYLAFEDPARGLDGVLRPDARRHDTPALPREGIAMSLAAAKLLGGYGWAAVSARARAQAARLAALLAERGRTVAPRGDTTLVTWVQEGGAEASARLFDRGVVVRDLPGTPYLRASVGAWNDDDDIDRLLEAL